MKGIFYQNKLLEGTLFLVGFSIPISLAFNSVTIAFFILFSFLFFNPRRILRELNIKKTIYIIYIVFFIFQTISITYSYNKNLATENVLKNILFLILPIAFINISPLLNKASFKAFYYGLLAVVLLSISKVYYFLIKFLLMSKFLFQDFFREQFVEKSLFHIHVPYLSMIIVLLIIYTHKVKFLQNNYINKWFKISIIIMLISSLILLSGVMSIIVLVVFFLVQFSSSNISKINKFVLLFSAFLLFLISIYSINNIERVERIRGSENLVFRLQNITNIDSNVRFQNWSSVAEVILENFWLGVGADGGIIELLKHREPLTEPFVNMHNAHNNLLEIFLRYGFFGFVLYVIMLYTLLKKAFMSYDYYFIWFLMVFLMSGLTESYLQRQVGLTFFLFSSLLLYSLNQKKVKIEL